MKKLCLSAAALLCCANLAWAAIEVEFVAAIPCNIANPLCTNPGNQSDYIYNAEPHWRHDVEQRQQWAGPDTRNWR